MEIKMKKACPESLMSSVVAFELIFVKDPVQTLFRLSDKCVFIIF